MFYDLILRTLFRGQSVFPWVHNRNPNTEFSNITSLNESSFVLHNQGWHLTVLSSFDRVGHIKYWVSDSLF